MRMQRSVALGETNHLSTGARPLFIITMPLDFEVGDTREVEINFQPEQLEWRNVGTLTYGGDDYRIISTIIQQTEQGPVKRFYCDKIPEGLDIPLDLVTPL